MKQPPVGRVSILDNLLKVRRGERLEAAGEQERKGESGQKTKAIIRQIVFSHFPTLTLSHFHFTSLQVSFLVISFFRFHAETRQSVTFCADECYLRRCAI